MVEGLVKRLGRRAGIEVSRYRPFAARRAHLLGQYAIRTVIDVGANTGGYGRDLRAFGYTGRIVSFEPLSSVFAELERRTAGDPAWECQKLALGDIEGESDMNVASKTGSSSLLAMREEHRSGAPDVFYTGQERIRLQQLDSLHLDLRPPTMLKIDVQGYEDRVIAGATRTLADVVLIECELSIARLYEGQLLFREMIHRLFDLGFELVDLDPFFYDRIDGRVLAMDSIFAREASEVSARTRL